MCQKHWTKWLQKVIDNRKILADKTSKSTCLLWERDSDINNANLMHGTQEKIA